MGMRFALVKALKCQVTAVKASPSSRVSPYDEESKVYALCKPGPVRV
jgi:hypothetical protein